MAEGDALRDLHIRRAGQVKAAALPVSAGGGVFGDRAGLDAQLAPDKDAAAPFGAVAGDGAALDDAGGIGVDVDAAAIIGVAAGDEAGAHAVLYGQGGSVRDVEDALGVPVLRLGPDGVAVQVQGDVLRPVDLYGLGRGDVRAQPNGFSAGRDRPLQFGYAVDDIVRLCRKGRKGETWEHADHHHHDEQQAHGSSGLHGVSASFCVGPIWLPFHLRGAGPGSINK